MKRAEVPIVEVTLMEDRARVVRRGTVELEAGPNRISIGDVAPVLIDKTLSARSESAAVTDASVERQKLHRLEDQKDEARELQARIEAARDDLGDRIQRQQRIDESLSLLDGAARHTFEELVEDASWGRTDEQAWKARLASVSELEDRLRSERLATVWEVDDARRELNRLSAKLAATSDVSRDLRATITILVEATAAGAHPIEIEYLVPSACWRPAHRASLENGRVTFESEGCVWQNTGEAWEGVTLRFSTQRPSLGAEPPELATERLRVQKKSERIVVEARAQIVETTGLGLADARVAEELPGIDDGGEVRELMAPHPMSVLSNGRPHRALLFAFDTDAEESLVCAPELEAAVLRKTALTNAGERPLLAGPVDLVSNGGFVGRTSILYVAPGERFELGWGPDPALRVHRDRVDSEETSKLLSNWRETDRKIVDKLSNLGPEPKRVVLVERIPVSELEKVKIELDEAETGRPADADGFVRWTIVLPPFGRDRAVLRYTVKRHADVSGDV